MTGPETLEGAWPRPEKVFVTVKGKLDGPRQEHSPDNPDCPWNNPMGDVPSRAIPCTCPAAEDPK